MKINYVNLAQQWAEDKIGLLKIIDQTLSTGKFVGGEQVDIFEKNIAKPCGCSIIIVKTRHVVINCAMIKNSIKITCQNSRFAGESCIIKFGSFYIKLLFFTTPNIGIFDFMIKIKFMNKISTLIKITRISLIISRIIIGRIIAS